MTKYPNLNELINYHPYGKPAVCDHAGIEPELLEAVLIGGESLTGTEILGLARLYRCPIGVLGNSEIVMLDMGKLKHKKMVREVELIYIQLRSMADGGNQDAEKYLNWVDWRKKRFMLAVYSNNLSYCHYLGIKEILCQYVGYAAPSPKRRGLAI